MNPVAYLPQSKRLLEQMRAVLRCKHYSLNTEQAYLYCFRPYVSWHARSGEMRHPRTVPVHSQDNVRAGFSGDAAAKRRASKKLLFL